MDKDPKEKKEEAVPEQEKEQLTSDTVANAHAAGDGAIERSPDNTITDKDDKPTESPY